MKRFSVSKLGLLRKCGAWLDLDYQEQPGAAATRGTHMHAIMAAYIHSGEVSDESWFANWRNEWDLRYSVPGQLAELAFALSPSSGEARVIGQFLDRNYNACSGDEIPGTADVVWVNETEAVVDDFKTGSVHADLYDAQMAGLALAASRAYGVPQVTTRCLYVDESGGITPYVKHFDALDLQDVLDELRLTIARDREPRPGSHCTSCFCPAVAVCPAVHKEASQLVPLGDILRGIDTPDRLRAWLESGPRIKKLTDELDKQAKRLCDELGGSVELGDGTSYIKQTYKRNAYSVGAGEASRYVRKKAG
jgi:hypothetical protein